MGPSKELIHANCDPGFCELSGWTNKCKGSMTNTGTGKLLIHEPLHSEEFGFIVIWRFLLLVNRKISLYVDQEHLKSVIQPVAEFPNI
jgi:hypothetical protein